MVFSVSFLQSKMAFTNCFGRHPQLSLKIGLTCKSPLDLPMRRRSTRSVESVTRRPSSQHVGGMGIRTSSDLSFLRGSLSIIPSNLETIELNRKSSRVVPLCLPPSQLASSVFTVGTAAVLPFYTLMVVAPRSELTRRTVESSTPYIVLGLLYAYLLYLSWTPDSLRYLFATKYYMPELSGMLKMFSSEMTLASAWIHLLVVDLFAARQVYHDGLQNNVETRLSVSFCLLCCPIGILIHVITKALTKRTKITEKKIHKV